MTPDYFLRSKFYVLFLFFSFISPPFVIDAQEQESPLHADWMEKDLKNIEYIRQHIPPKSQQASELVSLLDYSKSYERKDLGYGNESFLIRRPGGYTSCYIKLLSHKDALAALQIDCLYSGERADIQKLIREAWGSDVDQMKDGIRYEFVNHETMKRMQDAVTQELGIHKPSAIPEEYKEAYLILTDPFEQYDFGESCYYAGKPPAGRVAIRNLVDGRQIDLIRAALRSLNPEGRVYAAEVLINVRKAGQSIGDDDLTAIRKIRESEVLLSACYGCEIVKEKAKDLLPTLVFSGKAAHVAMFLVWSDDDDADGNEEILADYTYYMEIIGSWLNDLGIPYSFHGSKDFTVKVGLKPALKFTEEDLDDTLGFILFKPDGSYKILYGVHTDIDFIDCAKDYFGMR
jgi:hypothetical protein